ncbi:MAG: 6-pyruvoyl-tetrahydropterin synthase-related protein, partial [Patescibacteria group bacterium]
HVARSANFYQSLTEGNLVPRWAANLNWGYGHPILMFLYPLPSYLASFFHFLGFSYVDSTKVTFGLAYIASILAMFFWMRRQWGVWPGVVAAIFYGFAPYRFVDLYVRGAIGEHTAFVFPPLVGYGLLGLAKVKKVELLDLILTAGGVAGLILAHNAVSLMFLPVIGLYAWYLLAFVARDKKSFILVAASALFWGFMLAAFFWIPALLEGKYTLRDIVTRGDFRNRFVPFSWFFYSPWNYGGAVQFSKQVGFSHWLTVLASFWLFLKTKQKEIRWFLGGSLVIFFFSLFIMTGWSRPLWENLSILQKFQFPWRWLSVTVFVAAAAAGGVAHLWGKKMRDVVFTIILVVTVIYTLPMWRPKVYLQKPEDFYTGVYNSTTDTGESSPRWSVRFMEKRPKEVIEVAEGQASVTLGRRTTTEHNYVIKASTRARLVENTLYFPGWKVRVDGRQAEVEFQDPSYRGLMTFWVEEGTHEVSVRFGETKLRKAANLLALGAWGLLAGVIGAKIVTRKLWLNFR